MTVYVYNCCISAIYVLMLMISIIYGMFIYTALVYLYITMFTILIYCT